MPLLLQQKYNGRLTHFYVYYTESQVVTLAVTLALLLNVLRVVGSYLKFRSRYFGGSHVAEDPTLRTSRRLFRANMRTRSWRDYINCKTIAEVYCA
jgi:hypothetical protein